jgi:hypothetical protein
VVHGVVEPDARAELAAGGAGRRVGRTCRAAFIAALLAGLVLAVASAWQTPGAAARVAKGLWDDSFVTANAAKQNSILNEIASPSQLHASTVRLMVFWARAEPTKGAFDEAYLMQLKTAIDAAQAHRLRVILTTYEVPKWASNTSLWRSPPRGPFGFKKNIYYYFYAPKAAALPEFSNFAQHVAEEFKGEVFAYEAWNEANIFWFLYPQRTATDGNAGARTYFGMLKAFSKGIRAGDPAAKVLGGNTASQGVNNVRSTSPLKWAHWLKSHGVLHYADAYSHHVYALGGIGQPILAPELPPRFPQWTVVLGNIGTLLHIFPKTAFYLTEWGYNARDSKLFGGGGVGEQTQAQYLTRGFKLAGKYPQIKLLMWYLRVDVKGGSSVFSPPMSSGLRRANGTKKPAWTAFRNVR